MVCKKKIDKMICMEDMEEVINKIMEIVIIVSKDRGMGKVMVQIIINLNHIIEYENS